MDNEASKPEPVTVKGIAVSPGIALGPALLYRSPVLDVDSAQQAPANPAAERERLHAALDRGVIELQALADRVSRDVGQSESDIFTAQALMLADPTIAERADTLIEQTGATAAEALSRAAEEQANILAQLSDPLWRERAVDVQDAARAALAHLTPLQQPTLARALSTVVEPVVVVADDLTPSDTAQMSLDNVCAIALAQGAFTSHAAIIARALHIPAVVGLDPRYMKAIQNGDPLLVDGVRGMVTIHPDEASSDNARTSAERYRRDLRTTQLRRAALTEKHGSTRDGHRIQLLANVGSVADARAASEAGAEGIGLLRTEFLLSEGTALFDEQQQADLYTKVILASGPTQGPIVVRTIDAGGDKPLPALLPSLSQSRQMAEANPALGVRGIRFQAGIAGLLATQLRAIVLTAERTNADVRVMLPMVSTVDEIRAAHQVLASVHADANIAPDRSVPVGVMIETPAAVLTLDLLAQAAVFFSIGTNDLTQYIMAADRLNPQLAALCSPVQPAVLRAISAIRTTAQAAQRHVAVCGEMAGDPLLALLLVGLGIEALSMAPVNIPAVKEALAIRTLAELQAIAERALHLATVGEIEQCLGELAQ
ncbi:MAG TPA: phosphoenolpyruvate--protein phosphotransferase [Ktedonobacterales bacterium]|nr:phosphoenolpyruvate--protein phosphotransferase [Ktedonobacterales bacterium]